MDYLHRFYEKCVAYMDGSDNESASEIISTAVRVLEDIPELEDMHARCVFHTDWWGGESLEEHCDDASVIVEELCAELGAYLADE